MSSPLRELPNDLPVPQDDGGADHLLGSVVPHVRLSSSQGGELDLAAVATEPLVAYVYPMTGAPGRRLPRGWIEIPGAYGCTAESCAFRDHAAELQGLGARVAGVSAQDPKEQRAFASREGISYPLLNDSAFELAKVLGLPTFDAEGQRFYKRLTFIARGGRIERVFYPVFPPDQHPAQVISWLAGETSCNS